VSVTTVPFVIVESRSGSDDVVENVGTAVGTVMGNAVVDVALESTIVLVVRLEYRVVVLSVGWTIVWRTVCAP